MTTNLTLPEIPRAQMFIGGTMTLVWQQFFRSLFIRTGGNNELSNSELADLINFSGLTQDRIIFLNSSDQFDSVTNLANWIAGTVKQITVTNDGDGTVTISIPDDLAVNSSMTAPIFYLGDKDTDGTYRIIPDGDNLNFERRESGAWVRKGDVRP